MLKKITNTATKKRLISNLASLLVLRGFQFLIPLITLPYLVRTIGIEKFGLINFALSLGLYFGAVIEYGFGVTATREIARNRDNPEKLAQIYSTTVAASCSLAILCVIVFLPLVLFVTQLREYLSLYVCTLAFVMFRGLFPIWFFQGMEKMKYITFLSLGANGLFLASLFLFVKQQDDYVLVPFLNAIAAFVSFILAIKIINKQFKVCFKLPNAKDIKAIFQDGKDAFISQLAPTFYNNSSVFLLGLFTNNTTVGLYAASTKVIDAVISLAHILSKTFLPYLSRNMKKHAVFQVIMLSSGVALTLSTYFMADMIAELLFSKDNVEIAVYIRWLASCIFLLFAIMVYGTNYLMLIGKDGIVRGIAVYTAFVFFTIALIIIPLWGIWGAIVTLLGARLAMMLGTVFFYIKFKKQSLFI